MAGKEEEVEATPVIKLRNYVPEDDSKFEHTKVAAAKGKAEDKLIVAEPAEEEEEADPEQGLTVAPTKANWDLKKDVEKKIRKLEKRTQKAMMELMREEEEARLRQTN
jgi:coiled-coil domain-containing protein 12